MSTFADELNGRLSTDIVISSVVLLPVVMVYDIEVMSSLPLLVIFTGIVTDSPFRTYDVPKSEGVALLFVSSTPSTKIWNASLPKPLPYRSCHSIFPGAQIRNALGTSSVPQHMMG